MADVFTKEKRSEIMSKIHGGLKDNNLERRVHNWLKGEHIRHTMYPKINGNPDVVLENNGRPVYVFIDGCFWHVCPEHYRRPKTRKKFWIRHVEKSNSRRELARKKLQYRWIRIWEHDVGDGTFKDKIMDTMGDNKS